MYVCDTSSSFIQKLSLKLFDADRLTALLFIAKMDRNKTSIRLNMMSLYFMAKGRISVHKLSTMYPMRTANPTAATRYLMRHYSRLTNPYTIHLVNISRTLEILVKKGSIKDKNEVGVSQDGEMKPVKKADAALL